MPWGFWAAFEWIATAMLSATINHPPPWGALSLAPTHFICHPLWLWWRAKQTESRHNKRPIETKSKKNCLSTTEIFHQIPSLWIVIKLHFKWLAIKTKTNWKHKLFMQKAGIQTNVIRDCPGCANVDGIAQSLSVSRPRRNENFSEIGGYFIKNFQHCFHNFHFESHALPFTYDSFSSAPQNIQNASIQLLKCFEKSKLNFSGLTGSKKLYQVQCLNILTSDVGEGWCKSLLDKSELMSVNVNGTRMWTQERYVMKMDPCYIGRGRGDEWFDVSVDWISKSN